MGDSKGKGIATDHACKSYGIIDLTFNRTLFMIQEGGRCMIVILATLMRRIGLKDFNVP